MTRSEIRNYLFYLLGRRDYSQFELKQKLTQKCEELNDEIEAEIEQCLADFANDGYQSDERFAFAYVRSKAMSLKGPSKIRFELSRKGISNDLIEQAVNQEEIDWFELALRLKIKKFGEDKISDFKLRQKAWRSLASRGFSGDALNYALNHPED